MSKPLQFLWQNFRFRNALTTSAIVGATASGFLMIQGAVQPTGLLKLSSFVLATAVAEASRRSGFSALDLYDTGADIEYAERRAVVANHMHNLTEETKAAEEAPVVADALTIIDNVAEYWQKQNKHLMIIGGTGAGKTYFMQKFYKLLPGWDIKVFDVDATKDDWKGASTVSNREADIMEEMQADLDGIEPLASERDRVGSEKWKPKQMQLIICDEFPVTMNSIDKLTGRDKLASTWSTTHAKRTRKLGIFIALMMQNDTVTNTGLKGDNAVRDSCFTRVYLGIDALKRAKKLEDKRILEWLQQHNQFDVCLVDDLPARRPT